MRSLPGSSSWWTSRRQYSAQEHAVGVEREHVVAVGDLQGVGSIAVAQDGAELGLDLLDPASHQPEVGVEVHRLVRVVRQVGVLLALEGGDVRLEGPHQAPGQLDQPLGGQDRPLVQGREERASRDLEVPREGTEDLVGEEVVRVGGPREGARLLAQPLARPDEVERQGADLVVAARAAVHQVRLVAFQCRAEPLVGPRQQGVDLVGQGPAAGQARRCGRVGAGSAGRRAGGPSESPGTPAGPPTAGWSAPPPGPRSTTAPAR